MRWKYALGLLVLACVVAGFLEAKEPKPASSNVSTKTCKPLIESQKPMSIFNDEVRLFKFRIDRTVTFDEVRGFMTQYRADRNPDIIGAYPDPDTNSLCVVGPPEAELAIRKTLATRLIELGEGGGGIPGTYLMMQKRKLQADRKELLQEIGSIEIALVDVESGKDKKEAAELKDRKVAFERELGVVERKIQIANKYLERINEDSE